MPIEYANNLRLFLYRNAQKNDNEFIADVKNKVHEAKEQLTEVKKTKAYVVKEGTITATKKTYCDSICTISMRMMNKKYTASLPALYWKEVNKELLLNMMYDAITSSSSKVALQSIIDELFNKMEPGKTQEMFRLFGT